MRFIPEGFIKQISFSSDNCCGQFDAYEHSIAHLLNHLRRYSFPEWITTSEPLELSMPASKNVTLSLSKIFAGKNLNSIVLIPFRKFLISNKIYYFLKQIFLTLIATTKQSS